jgi:hypothetical protein
MKLEAIIDTAPIQDLKLDVHVAFSDSMHKFIIHEIALRYVIHGVECF